MIRKILWAAFFIFAASNTICAQQNGEVSMRTLIASNGVSTGNNNTANYIAEPKYTLDSYGSTTKIKPGFDEEHFLGDEISKKWNIFQQSYKRVYEQTVGLSGSTVEILKPVIYNAVNKVNNYYKKTTKNETTTKDEALMVISHILDCANLLCYEDDTKKIEADLKNARNAQDIILVFASIHINYH